MSDINLLPEEIRRREEKERQKPFRPSQIPMSTPILDEEIAKHSLIIRAPKSPAAPLSEEHVKHLREESYIRIDKEGKIVRETKAPTKYAERTPWWQWFFRPLL